MEIKSQWQFGNIKIYFPLNPKKISIEEKWIKEMANGMTAEIDKFIYDEFTKAIKKQ